MSILNLQLNWGKKIERYTIHGVAGNTIEVLWFTLYVHNYIIHSTIGLQLLTTDSSFLLPLALILGLNVQRIAPFYLYYTL